MKYIVLALTLFLLTGCNGMEKRIPMPSEMPTALPTITPAPTATEGPVALGLFITEILDTDPKRVQNLQLCASVLSGLRIEPGAEFSFNNTVGQRTAEKGYQEAAILIDGERDHATGGGICQISSTLYNAAASAGMEILERHSHTNEVHYVELGSDAAVVYGAQDFRFRNPLPEPVSIEILVENTEVKAVLYKIVNNI